jgi:glycosyltransferase involved in cell wall biosynthesis
MECHIQLGYPSYKFEIIPNGFDISLFHPDSVAALSLREEFGLNTTDPVIGHLARFDPQKDHHTLIKAAELVIKSLPDARFILCGENINWDNQKLVGWIDEAGIRDHFLLLGRRDDMPRILAGLDLLVSSSVGEAFPTVLGEAMACGIPCVATDVGDSGLIIGETGILVPPCEPGPLAQGLIDMLKLSGSERELLGQKARKRVIENFNLPDIVNKYEKTFLQVIGR